MGGNIILRDPERVKRGPVTAPRLTVTTPILNPGPSPEAASIKTAVLVLTKNGLRLARQIADVHSGPVVVYGPACVVGHCELARPPDRSPAGFSLTGAFATDDPIVFGWRGPLRRFLPSVWNEVDAVVAIMALGIVVRLVGPLVKDKKTEPAVIAVDDRGRFAISVLGGHSANANALAREIARAIHAIPVVTTASESHGLPAVDLIGRDLGWKIERTENLTWVAAAVVRQEPIGVFQDAGARDWWLPFGDWPEHFVRVQTWEELAAIRSSAVLAISDRVIPRDVPQDHIVVYRPPSLVAGVGCKRGTTAETIARFVGEVFADHGLAQSSLSALATVSLKADEPGLVEFAEKNALPLVAFGPGELADQPGVENPSAKVKNLLGIASVSEAAALRAAGAVRLLVPKRKGAGITLAVARRPHQTVNEGGPNPGA
jgi:cobalt-precorrin 5A hydrolase